MSPSRCGGVRSFSVKKFRRLTLDFAAGKITVVFLDGKRQVSYADAKVMRALLAFDTVHGISSA